ncbi:hypothetical protein CCAX7_42570 [Capsulimonas corticalis]|uniref:Uncharacterized protein n=1 Tax=Capsulimonas corticalis TaxID=2219043 RepID=A0A402CXP1_9BACT|nr:CHAD domain-containing protein [Capsulimonas corticalis]BDI32206.1 hypothetical protein CCAX7_42570 [Capsulimonas corticalis]
MKSPYNITADASFTQSAVTALKTQFDEVMKNLPGTRAGDDIEALHDMRVATRRLRAAMSIFGPVFPEKQFRPLEKEVARITDALGGVRDADVQIDFMQKMSDSVPEAEKVGLQAFMEHLNAQRDRDRVIMIKELNRLEKSKFSRDFEAMLDQLQEDADHG